MVFPKELINGKEIKRPFNKYWFEVPLRVLVNSFYQSCHLMSKHLFHFKWQSIQYERSRSTMVIGEVGLVMDFGQNINHRRQFEAQSSHFNCQQSSIFPLVCFFPCPLCHMLVTHEICCITDDLGHDAYAVRMFELEAIIKFLNLAVYLSTKFMSGQTTVVWNSKVSTHCMSFH